MPEESLKDINENLKAAKAYQALHDFEGLAGCQTTTQQVKGTCETDELIIHRLYRERSKCAASHQKLDRVIDILQRHPEFQEFLEVLRSGLV